MSLALLDTIDLSHVVFVTEKTMERLFLETTCKTSAPVGHLARNDFPAAFVTCYFIPKDCNVGESIAEVM
jgi:hypothetical protein